MHRIPNQTNEMRCSHGEINVWHENIRMHSRSPLFLVVPSISGTGTPVLLSLAVGESDGVELLLGVPVPVAVLLGVPVQDESNHT